MKLPKKVRAFLRGYGSILFLVPTPPVEIRRPRPVKESLRRDWSRVVRW